MKYRVANKEDLKEILEMKRIVKERVIREKLPIWQNGYPWDDFIEEDVMLKQGRVIEEEGKIIAYACFHEAKTEYPEDTFLKKNVMSFSRIMVHDDYLNQHVGSFFIKKMIEEAKREGYEGMGILADHENKRALHVYQKQGFQYEGERQFSFAYLEIYGLYF